MNKTTYRDLKNDPVELNNAVTVFRLCFLIEMEKQEVLEYLI